MEAVPGQEAKPQGFERPSGQAARLRIRERCAQKAHKNDQHLSCFHHAANFCNEEATTFQRQATKIRSFTVAMQQSTCLAALDIFADLRPITVTTLGRAVEPGEEMFGVAHAAGETQ